MRCAVRGKKIYRLFNLTLMRFESIVEILSHYTAHRAPFNYFSLS